MLLINYGVLKGINIVCHHTPTWRVACDFSHIFSLWISWRGVRLSHILVFHMPKLHMIALSKLWKMFFVSSKKFFSFLRYSDFCISVLHPFSPCQPLLKRLIRDKSLNLWCHQLSKEEHNNIFCLISWEGKNVWNWNFVHW